MKEIVNANQPSHVLIIKYAELMLLTNLSNLLHLILLRPADLILLLTIRLNSNDFG